MKIFENSEDFWVEKLPDGRTRLHLRASATFKLVRGTTAPESCEDKIYFTEKYGPWPVPAQVHIVGSVDDDVIVNGVVVDDGLRLFSSGYPCSSTRNIGGDFDYTVMIPANTPLVIQVRNNIQGACGINCTITVTLKGK